MEDIIKSIKAHLYDRAVSPLSGALIISWCLWNYKVLFVLLSSESMIYKLNFVDEFYAQIFLFNLWWSSFNTSNSIVNGVLGPIVTTLMYLFIYPLFAVPGYKFSLWVQKKYDMAKNDHQKNKLLTYEQSIELHKKIAELELQKESEHKDYLNRIDALNELVNNKNSLLLSSEKNYQELVAKYEILHSEGTLSSGAHGSSNEKGEMFSGDDSLGGAVDGEEDPLSKPELKELEGFIVNALFQKKAGEQFVFSSLIPAETWAHYSDENRFSLERSFRFGVDSRRYRNVKVSEKQIDGSVTKYTILDFLECKDSKSVLIYILEKIAASKYKTVQESELKSWREWNFHLLKNGIDYLLEKGFVEGVIHSGRPAFRLKKEGELYLAGSR